MKKVKYTNIDNDWPWTYGSLKNGNIYDVIRYIPSLAGFMSDQIEIYNDNGKPSIYNVYAYNNCVFEDATVEYRDLVIDDILN